MVFFQQASSAAGKVDSVFLFIVALCAIALFFITFLMVYFVIKYSKKRHPRGVDIEGNTWLEIAWTVTPTVLFLVMFYYGWTNYEYEREVPRDAMVVNVTARQWAYSFSYPNAKRTAELYLALNKPFKMELHSLDVIHGFYIPAFRVKEDIVPGKSNYTWFIPTMLGSFDIECTVICGIGHAKMLSKAVVVPVADFEAWYFGDENAPLPGQKRVTAVQPAAAVAAAVEPGLAVLQQKDCLVCHSVDGSERVGVSLKGLYGKQQTVTQGGKEQQVTVDEAYLAKAIREPHTQLVKGYHHVMPVPSLNDDEIGQVIAYVKELE
jgi:cytochrome c oxidase subunit 2